MSNSPEVAEWKAARAALDNLSPEDGDNLTPGTVAYAANQRVIEAEKNLA
jgi:hypothetical protein